jgi:hypothetical protein
MFCFRQYRSRLARGGSGVLTEVLVFISLYGLYNGIGLPWGCVGLEMVQYQLDNKFWRTRASIEPAIAARP